MTIIVMDFETTGLCNVSAAPLSSQPHAIEFAAKKHDDDMNEIGTLEFICNPGIPLSDIITKITGLHDSDVQDKLPFSAHMQELCDFFVGAHTVIAHNVKFDLSIMEYELRRLDRVTSFPWPPRQICTVEKTMYLQGYRLNLGKLYKKATGEDHINNAHRAMADVEALVKIVKWLKEKNIL